MRFSSLIAKLEERAIAAYADIKPRLDAKRVEMHAQLTIRVEAAKHAHTFYKQVVADVQAKRS